MRRFLRRLAFALLVGALVAAPVIFTLTARPDLENARDHVDDEWARLQPGLAERYASLAAARDAAAATGIQAAVLDDLDRALEDWSVRQREDDPAAEVQAANALEGLGARLAAAAAAPRLAADEGLAFALAVYGDRTPDAELVSDYSDAVQSYEDSRNNALRRPLSGLFGFEERAEFAPSAEA